MLSSNHHRIRWQHIVGALILVCAVMDFFPRHGAPWFRYTGSDPAVEVWNLGWPMVLSICDQRSGLHIGPFLYVVVPFQLVVVSVIGVMFAFWTRHKQSPLLSTMRHIQLLLLRLLPAAGVVLSLPLSHALWGTSYPGDGQQEFGFIIIFTLIGIGAAALFYLLGSLGQFLLRRRPTYLTILTDLSLFCIIAGSLIYSGVTARYIDSTPPKKGLPKASVSDKPMVLRLSQSFQST